MHWQSAVNMCWWRRSWKERLVVGIRDTELSERLQLYPDLTLEKAQKAVWQKEAVHEHQQVLREGESKKFLIQIYTVQQKPKHQQLRTQWRTVVKHSLKVKKHCTRVWRWTASMKELSSKRGYLFLLSQQGTLQLTVPHQDEEGLLSTSCRAHCSGCRIARSRQSVPKYSCSWFWKLLDS